MTSVRGKGQPAVGSARWVYDERDVAQQFIEQEVEEFAFSARTELEWLNEHMADISSQNQFNITEAFKTPGKLRGKTPRTARKLLQSAVRAPLTDIFTSHPQPLHSPSIKSRLQKPATQFNISEDKENAPTQASSAKSEGLNPPAADTGLGVVDDVHMHSPSPKAPLIPPKSPQRSPFRKHNAPMSPGLASCREPVHTEDVRESEESFVSADEAPASESANTAGRQEIETTNLDEHVINQPAKDDSRSSPRVVSYPFSISAETDAGMQEAADHVERTSPARNHNMDEPSSSSDTSSSERPVMHKKSSLSLASLPPRDPLTTKRSFGTATTYGLARNSTKDFSAIRDSFLNRNKQSYGGEPTHEASRMNESRDPRLLDNEQDTLEDSHQAETSMLHNKTSTQRLHERMAMLGKANPSRASRSISSSLANAHATSRRTEQLEQSELSSKPKVNVDDDWIAPISQDQDRAAEHLQDEGTNGIITTSDAPQSKPTYPELPSAPVESTTPTGSPSRWTADGPLSASKAKFQSFLRSAKGMFASSAATSAQAKMEAMAPSPARGKPAHEGQENIEVQEPQKPSLAATQPVSKVHLAPTARKRSASEGPLHDDRDAKDAQPPTKRRSSRLISEKEAREDATRQTPAVVMDAQLEELNQMKVLRKPSEEQPHKLETRDISRPPIKKPVKPTESQPRVADAKHPKQIAKANTASKAKPGQISVMLPSMRPQLGVTGNSIKSSGQHLNNSQSSTTARPVLTKKASDSSVRSASSQSIRSAPANTKLKALESARRKREQDEREQQRKEEQKKALEKKKAEKAEEERQAHERKLVEQKREADARAAAQKRAAEQHKAEKQQREEQLRMQGEAAKSRPGNDSMAKSQTERSAMSSKTDKVPLRPESRGQESSRPTVPHVNPAKPAKRYFNPDADELVAPAPQAAASNQSGSTDLQKKPKMSEEFELRTQAQPLARVPIGAPMRPSVAKKQELPAKFQHGFMSSVGTSQQGSSMLKNAISTSQQMQGHPKTPHGMNDMVKFANARIPFAEAPNPPGPNSQASHQTLRTVQKTPASVASIAKSSPGFPNGDNISLPEIATDSEDEDSDDAFEAPDWTNSPELRQLLEQQQLVDPTRVFGPIGSLNMEEVFKGTNKDRLKRFRDRTSSANWNGPDRLTEEERRRDREAREKLERDGGWTYETSMEIEKSGKA